MRAQTCKSGRPLSSGEPLPNDDVNARKRARAAERRARQEEPRPAFADILLAEVEPRLPTSKEIAAERQRRQKQQQKELKAKEKKEQKEQKKQERQKQQAEKKAIKAERRREKGKGNAGSKAAPTADANKAPPAAAK